MVREAEALNVPLRVVRGGSAPDAVESRAVRVTHAGHHAVDVSAVKLADDASGDVVVRIAEVTGARTPVTVAVSRRVESASRCNALEEPLQPLDVADGIVSLTLQPFELVTLRLTD